MVENSISSERLIVALDVPSERAALELIAQLEDSVTFFKIGLELFTSCCGLDLVERLTSQGYRVFADFKLLDIPQTVSRAVQNLNGRGIDFLTIHAEPQTMQAAVEAADGLSLLAVTVLTSLTDDTLHAMGYSINTVYLVQFRAADACLICCPRLLA